MIIRGKAPLRVSFSGGGSDVSPYCDEYGGCVLSTTIGMYIYGALEVRNDNEVHIFSLEYNELVTYELGSEIAEGDKLSFLRAYCWPNQPCFQFGVDPLRYGAAGLHGGTR
jgi:D-glycero-alpha-D-manno-heptose-7-phosphate kinase